MKKQQSVFLTGAGGALGMSIANKLSALGYQMLLCDLPAQEQQLHRMAEQIQETGVPAHVVIGDVSDQEQVKAMVHQVQERVGSIQVLINNAGMNCPKTLRRTTKEEWERVMAVNLTGPFLVMQAFAPMMIKQKYGRIINISALIGQAGYPAAIAYGASKSGLLGLTRCAAAELASYNITCNAIAPGFLNTSFLSHMPEEWKADIKTQIPLGRMGEVDEMAPFVAFLASEESSYTTGAVFQVNGGLLS